MKRYLLIVGALLVASTFVVGIATAQQSSPPPTAADREAAYQAAIERRTEDILQTLALDDAAKVARVRDAIMAHYRALRARDEVIDAKLKEQGKEITYTNREPLMRGVTRALHDAFLARLSLDLTPEQVEKVKDKLTYNKVKVTYDAYCDIVPDLTDADKAKIKELLIAAREEAIDGGSAGEKSAIFQKYKDQINDYLTAQGHDLAKAYREWAAKQEQAEKQKIETAESKTNQAK